MLDEALAYARLGFKVLPLKNKDKIPILQEWPKYASSEESQILSWFEGTASNIGIQLGPRSGIVDIEFDTDEGKRSADRLIGDAITPTYTSGSRSVHRIFKWWEGLPDQAVVKLLGIEIRIGGGNRGAQSVFPPSVHPSGSIYRWLPGLSPEDVPIMDFPESIRVLLANDPLDEAVTIPQRQRRTQDHWDRILGKGSQEGTRNDDITSVIGLLLRGLSDEAIEDQQQLLNCLKLAKATGKLFSPPLDEKEIEKSFKSILKRDRNRRASISASVIVRPNVDGQIDNLESGATGDWHLTIVRGDPPIYELYAPQFAQAPGGKIELSGEQLLSSRSVALEALKQAEMGLPSAFHKLWNQGGLLEALVQTAEKEEAPDELKRHIQIKQAIFDQIQNRKQLKEGDEPSPRGIWEFPNGDVAFIFRYLHAMLQISLRRITQPELSKTLRDCAPRKVKYNGKRYFVISRSKLKTLDDVA